MYQMLKQYLIDTIYNIGYKNSLLYKGQIWYFFCTGTKACNILNVSVIQYALKFRHKLAHLWKCSS